MLTLVIGGSGSGKSEYAERLAVRLAGTGPRTYLATMQVWDDECRRRVERHRRQRAGRGFATLERPQDLTGIPVQALDGRGTILLEDLGNLAANELYGAAPAEEAGPRILQGIGHLCRCCRHLVIVSNEVGCGGTDYAGDTGTYLHLLAGLHRALARQADAVCEVAAGLAAYYKGGEEL